MKLKKQLIKKYKILALFFAVILLLFLGIMAQLNSKMLASYEKNRSFYVKDSKGQLIFIKKNDQQNYAHYLEQIPERFTELLLKKEDKYFYFHFGFNPLGMAHAVLNKIGLSQRQGSSTITQQLAKILLSQENKRNINNKINESFYALSLEIFNSKDKILKMYQNSIYFGNQIQGVQTASLAYFDLDPKNLSDEQASQLLATINSPSNYNPLSALNIEKAKAIADSFKLKSENFISAKDCQKNVQKYFTKNEPILELAPYLQNIGKKDIELTIDNELVLKVRSIVQNNINILKTRKAKNAAVVILSVPENRILSLIGSADPSSYSDGYQINMATKPRQIGSTIKPFIYLLGFEKGMRPYTIIDDREYKYTTAEGYSIYPKNYDNKYHGKMTAHYALSNSINVAAVKTLEFSGLENFNNFLLKDLDYAPPQPIGQYQLGIALGSLEMSLLDLSHYFSIFASKGKLSGLKIFSDGEINNNIFPYQNKTVSKEDYIQLINKILSDRKTGVDQFGAESALNLPAKNYALKTGTSHDFTDSWIVGYTPDFLVGVWVGNADNSPTDGVSGQIGAGKIWNQVMELMLNSDYNSKSNFDFSLLKQYQGKSGTEFGLAGDDFKKAEAIIESQDKELILNPHDGDVFLLSEDARIILKSKTAANWKINGQNYGHESEIIFLPKSRGHYEITASALDKNETIEIEIIESP